MSQELGSEQRPLRVCIIGSGPSGFYSAEALLKSGITASIDILDKLPAPFGLVRYGVAPDHQKIKNVTKVFEKTMENENVRFFGNINVGNDISVEDLKRFYDAIIICSGAESDRKLGIDGENLLGSHTATEFVGWYNGHPDFQNREFDLSHEVVVIIGQGNVAIDVARILSKTVEELKETDITQHALEVLAASKVKEVHMIGRRGPVQAAFTPVEIREFGHLTDCAAIIDPEELKLSDASQKEKDDPAHAPKKKNYDILTELSQMPIEGKSRKFFLHFRKSPVEIQGTGRVQRIVLEKNQLFGEPGAQKARGTGERETLECGLFFRSVGYRGIPLKGLPFHDQAGVIPNQQGRVMDSEQVFTGLYVAGWIKRGPSGVIGTNKPDADETVKALIEDIPHFKGCSDPSVEGFVQFLKENEIHYVTFEDWKKIDAAEIARGQKLGKPREKFVKVDGMLSVL